MSDRALLVGVTEYKSKRLSAECELCDMDLRSAEQDVALMRTLLQQNGFSPDSILELIGYTATTRQAILLGLEWLVTDARAGDRLVLYYSGHGGSVEDAAVLDEQDEMDEVLCPSDTDWARHYISDDDLGYFMRKKLPRGVNLEVILECCAAGGLLDKLLLPRRGESKLLPDNVAVWAAARSEQYAHIDHFETPPRGLFTHHFARVVGEGPDRSRATVERLVGEAVSALYEKLLPAKKMGNQDPKLYVKGGLLRQQDVFKFSAVQLAAA